MIPQADGAGGPPAADDAHGTAVLDDRAYQREAVDAIAVGLASGGRGQLEAACGTGKTLISVRAAARLVPESGLVVVLTPSLGLVAQTLETWRDRDPVGVDSVLAVCSDDTVADAPVHPGDLTAQVTTDPTRVAEWAGGRGRRLLVGTYRSASVVAEALHTLGRGADLLICDEAHHLAGKAEHTTRRVLDGQWMPAQRHLFMTATRRLSRSYDDDIVVVTMDDETVFGPLLYRYPFSRGIEDGYLKDYRLLVVGITDSEGRAMLGEQGREYVDRIGAPDLRTVVAQAALGRAHTVHGVGRVITYHPRVEQAAEFTRTLSQAIRRLPAAHRPEGPLAAGHVHGGMTQRQREVILDSLREPPPGGWAVVSNARCLSEGIDLPAVDAVMFAHPKKSTVDIVQAVGRALRRGGNNIATIIVPVVVPDADGEVGDLDPGEYQTLWNVVRALRAHDEDLAEALDFERSRGPREDLDLPSKITVEVSPDVTDRVLASLRLLLIRQATSVWLEGYGAAVRWHAQHGHLDIPQRYIAPDGIRLGGWLSDQRGRQRRGLLPPGKVEALERLGVVWDSQRRTYDQWLADVAAYAAEHGHPRVPVDYVTADGTRLGSWLAQQRYLQGTNRLPQHRLRQLEELGVEWTEQIAFPDRLARLRDYITEHGSLPKTSFTSPDGLKLGTWVSQQRSHMRAGRLSADREAALRRLGVTPDTNYRSVSDWLDVARVYRAEHGHLQVPQDHVAKGGARLGSWISKIRALQKKGTLAAETAAELDALGMVWDASPQSVGLAAARAWYERHGNLRVPKGTIELGVNLQQWIIDRRSERRTGALDPDVAAALDEMGIVWEPYADRWSAGLAAAAEFAAEHGHLTVPHGARVGGVALASWLNAQRAARRKGQLAPERVADLDRLGLVWDPHEQDWRDGLADVTEYAAEHGHVVIPGGARGTRIKALGLWLQRRRGEHRAGRLAPERVAALEALGVVWDDE